MYRKKLTDSDLETGDWRHVLASWHDSIVRVFRCCAIIIGVFGLLRAFGYSPWQEPERIPDGLLIITTFVPLWVYSLAWSLAGIAALIGAKLVRPYAGAGVAGMCFMWAIAYTASWVTSLSKIEFIFSWKIWEWSYIVPLGTPDPGLRDYLSASVYWTICLLCICGRYLASAALTRTGEGSDGGS